jgi:glyoxylase-like metal-dependent hydrolase (beta-lactamase superfamily II)
MATEGAGLLSAGDEVLPRITPSLALERIPPPSPLADFLTSLQSVSARPDAVLLPAHGPIGKRVHEQVDQLLTHHGNRLDATRRSARRTHHREIAAALPWTRRETRLIDLDPFDAMLATLETSAHLDVLVERGPVARIAHGELAGCTA